MAEQATQGTPSSAGGASSTAAPPDNGPGPLVMMIGAFLLFMYFMIWRPQKQEQKKKEEMLGQLKERSEVITFFGLYGTVVKIEGDDVVLLVDPKKDIKMRFRRSVIESITNPDEKKA